MTETLTPGERQAELSLDQLKQLVGLVEFDQSKDQSGRITTGIRFVVRRLST